MGARLLIPPADGFCINNLKTITIAGPWHSAVGEEKGDAVILCLGYSVWILLFLNYRTIT